MHRIAFYDMDKTITRRATFPRFLWLLLRRYARWRIVLCPLMAIGLLLYALRRLDRGGLKAFNLRLVMGASGDAGRLASLAEDFAGDIAHSGLNPGAVDQIAADRAAGYRLVMVSASYTLYVRAIARQLGFDDVLASELQTDARGAVLPVMAGANCYGKEKADRIARWFAAQGLERAQCQIRCYSDHISDVPLLALADEAFAVNAHPPLRVAAARRGWRLLDWR